MTTLENIKNDLDNARKEKKQQLLTLLVTLYSEACMVGKTKRNGLPTEEEVTSVVKKFKIGVEEIAKIKGLSDDLQYELDIYERYLPIMLTKDQLVEIVSGISPKPNNLGEVMKFLKEKYSGLYDGKVASDIAKEVLTK